MDTAAERYEQIVQIIHRHRAALEEGRPSYHDYWAWIMTKVFEVVKDDVRGLVTQDLVDVGEDTTKLKAKYAEWRKEIYAEMDEEAKKHGALSVAETQKRIAADDPKRPVEREDR